MSAPSGHRAAARSSDIKSGPVLMKPFASSATHPFSHALFASAPLRGRSGRQGDPGESRFFLSAEDDLIRLFAGERIYKILDKLGPGTTTARSTRSRPRC